MDPVQSRGFFSLTQSAAASSPSNLLGLGIRSTSLSGFAAKTHSVRVSSRKSSSSSLGIPRLPTSKPLPRKCMIDVAVGERGQMMARVIPCLNLRGTAQGWRVWAVRLLAGSIDPSHRSGALLVRVVR